MGGLHSRHHHDRAEGAATKGPAHRRSTSRNLQGLLGSAATSSDKEFKEAAAASALPASNGLSPSNRVSSPRSVFRRGGSSMLPTQPGVAQAAAATVPPGDSPPRAPFFSMATQALSALVATPSIDKTNSSSHLKGRLAASRSPAKYLEEYEELGTLGEGITGSVTEVIHRKTGKHYAMKTLNLNRFDKVQLKELRLEVEALKTVDHPNVLRLTETFEDARSLRLVMDLCMGGELAKRRLRKESEVINVLGQVITAVAHCHNVGIVHRDIKLENILFTSPDPTSLSVQLIDFGLSALAANPSRMGGSRFRSTGKNAGARREFQKRAFATTCGTSFYMAPEVLEKRYDAKCDMWSIGVVTYMLLTGRPPFDGPDERTVFRRIRECQVDYSSSVWSKISPHAKELVSHLLVLDPQTRWSAEKALTSPWFQPYHETVRSGFADADLDASVTRSLTDFVKYSRLKKAALMVIAHQKSQEELKDLSTAFKAVDTNNSGEISLDELAHMLRKTGKPGGDQPSAPGPDDTEIKMIFDAIDVDASGQIQFHEFLAATIEARCLVDHEAFSEAFDRISGGKDFVTRQDLGALLGTTISHAQAQAIIDELDQNGDGLLQRDEFLKIVDDVEEVLVEKLYAQATPVPPPST